MSQLTVLMVNSLYLTPVALALTIMLMSVLMRTTAVELRLESIVHTLTSFDEPFMQQLGAHLQKTEG